MISQTIQIILCCFRTFGTPWCYTICINITNLCYMLIHTKLNSYVLKEYYWNIIEIEEKIDNQLFTFRSLKLWCRLYNILYTGCTYIKYWPKLNQVALDWNKQDSSHNLWSRGRKLSKISGLYNYVLFTKVISLQKHFTI